MTKKDRNAFRKNLNWCDFEKSGSIGVGTTPRGRYVALMNDVAYNLRNSVNFTKDKDASDKQWIIFDEAWKRLEEAGIVAGAKAA